MNFGRCATAFPSCHCPRVVGPRPAPTSCKRRSGTGPGVVLGPCAGVHSPWSAGPGARAGTSARTMPDVAGGEDEHAVVAGRGVCRGLAADLGATAGAGLPAGLVHGGYLV